MVGKQILNPYQSAKALVAHWSTAQFHGKVTLRCRVRDVVMEKAFTVEKLIGDAILGMPFLMTNECSIHFPRPTISLQGREIMCTDKLV